MFYQSSISLLSSLVFVLITTKVTQFGLVPSKIIISKLALSTGNFFQITTLKFLELLLILIFLLRKSIVIGTKKCRKLRVPFELGR
jgi:hypothetical protein